MAGKLSDQNYRDNKPAVPAERIKQVAVKQLAIGCKLFSLMGNLPGMTYLCQNDENWTMEFVSDGCVQLTGYVPSDLIGNRKISYNDLIHPNDQLSVWVQIQEALAEKQLFQLVYRIRTAAGQEKLVWEQGMGVFSDKGVLLALTGFISDTINQRLVEEIESRLSDFWGRLNSES